MAPSPYAFEFSLIGTGVIAISQKARSLQAIDIVFPTE